jgi:hypothetical protein
MSVKQHDKPRHLFSRHTQLLQLLLSLRHCFATAIITFERLKVKEALVLIVWTASGCSRSVCPSSDVMQTSSSLRSSSVDTRRASRRLLTTDLMPRTADASGMLKCTTSCTRNKST